MKSTPHLLVLGHVTRDEVDGHIRLGGAASYAAQVAVCLGVDTALVTAAPPGDPLLAPLRALPGLALACADDPVITTFALDYAGPRRRLALRAWARPLVDADVPAAWLEAPVAYVGPVARECDRALVASLGARFDHPEAERMAARLAAAGTTVAVTRGARGATLLTPSGRLEMPAAAARERDPTRPAMCSASP